MKLIIKVNPETGEVEGFMWDKPGKPPPLIWPKTKSKGRPAKPKKKNKEKNTERKN